jgi:hypothetical protein
MVRGRRRRRKNSRAELGIAQVKLCLFWLNCKLFLIKDIISFSQKNFGPSGLFALHETKFPL